MPMQLLLIEDVDDLGRSGEVVSVKPGYARNFLLPKRMAVIADRNAKRLQVRLQEERLKKAAVDKEEAIQLAVQLNEIVVTTHVKVDHEGHMYGSVSHLDVMHLLEKEHSVHLERKMVVLPHPIKTVGSHKIPLRLKEGVPAEIKLRILVEGQTHTEEEKAALAQEKKVADEAPQ